MENKTKLKVILFSLSLVLPFFLGIYSQPLIQAKENIGWLNIKILPNINELPVGKNETFFAVVLHGSAPYCYEWKVNGSSYGDSASIVWGFQEPSSKPVLISVMVIDSIGNIGYAYQLIYDPASNIHLNDLPATATYTIRTDGTNYWAVKYDGDVLWESTNASYTINSAIGAWSVSIGVGTFDITSPIILKDNVEIYGNGNGTILKQMYNGSIFETATNDQARWVSISNLCIQGNRIAYSSGSGIEGTFHNSRFHDLSIEAFSENGIYLKSGGLPWEQRSYENFVVRNFIRRNDANIRLDHYSSDNTYLINTIKGAYDYGVYSDLESLGIWIGNHFVANEINFYSKSGGHVLNDNYFDTAAEYEIYLDASDNNLANVQIENNKFLPGTEIDNDFAIFYLKGSATYQVAFVKIERNTFYVAPNKNRPKYVILEETNASNNIFRNNNLLPRGAGNLWGASAFSLVSTNDVIQGNLGYKTENSGTTTVANNEWVSHGLVTTPTKVQVTTRTATYGTPAVAVVVGWVGQNATHFQVSAYWTNSTAITDDAVNISWMAEV